MSDDLLLRAARALREESAGDDASARFTRSRIMASVHEDRVKRRTRWAFLLPIAATFVAATAFGAVTGKTHAAVVAIARVFGFHDESEVPTPRVSVRRAPVQAAPIVSPPPVAVQGAAPVPEPPVAEIAPVPAPVTAVSATQSTASPAAPSSRLARDSSSLTAAASSHSLGVGGAAADPSFELYRSAHQAHFVDRDYARALGAWNAYLAAAPRGALVPEARYNRALCLLRLHRNDEARAALKPFAEGHYGSYRREDAAELIGALPPELSRP